MTGLIESFRDTEVRELHPSIGPHKNVGRFDVAVDDPVLMSMPECCGELHADFRSVGKSQCWTFVEHGSKITALDQLHDDGIGVIGSDRVVDRHDSGVCQSSCSLGFASKAVEDR